MIPLDNPGSRHLSDEEALAPPPLEPDVRVAWGEGPLASGDLRLPDRPGSRPVAVLVHGGCWRDIADRHYLDRLAVELVGAGWATWSVGFRRLGDPGGGWPGTFRDVAAAADHLRALAPEHALDLSRVVTVGHSSGGHLALWLAGRAAIPPDSELHDPDPLPIRAAVSLGGIADLEAFHRLDPERRACGDGVARLLGGDPADVPGRLAAVCPARLLPLGVLQLLVTGEDDADVPPAHVEAYAERARAAGDRVSHQVVPDAGHFEVVAPWSPRWPAVWPALLELLEEVDAGGRG